MMSAEQVPEEDPAEQAAQASQAAQTDDDERSAPPPDEPVDPYAEQASRNWLLGPEDDPD
jgi:hypothetical protein